MTERSGGIRAEALGKRFGDLWALRDLHLDVPAGTVLGLLGHNGAGKTTAIRILTTLSAPTEGRAWVDGVDVAAAPGAVRRSIGVAAQAATVDGLLSGRKNLEMVARLHGLTKPDARQRADELLDQLDLGDAKDKLAKEYSGGMRRRLDLAASIVTRPSVLFLDEPTTGLDPRSRGDLWEVLRGLVRDGTTVLLTTQYLEEADRLADDIVVLDHGRTVAQGTPAQLKSQIGDERVDVKMGTAHDLDQAVATLSPFASSRPTVDTDLLQITLPIKPGVRLVEVVRALDADGLDAVDLNRRGATLDDVFLSLTGATQRPELEEVPA
jgi:ABC-2 type transport system ATP-binding protein